MAIVVTFDNKNVRVTDNDKVIAEGNSPQHQVFAKNVVDRISAKHYDVSETNIGHKKVVTLCQKVQA